MFFYSLGKYILHTYKKKNTNTYNHTYIKSFWGLGFASAPLSLLREHLVFFFYHFSLEYFFLITFPLKIFLIAFSLMFFLITVLLELPSLHVSAFSWMFLISLCRSFHIVSSFLLFVLISCPPNWNSPRTWSVSSILGLRKDLLSIRHSSHLGTAV